MVTRPLPLSEDVPSVAEWADEDRRDRAAEDAAWERTRDAVLNGPKLRGRCSAVVGEPTVIRGDHAYCPSCGEDLCPNCPPGRHLEVGA